MNFMKMISENIMKTFNTLSKVVLLFVSEQKGNKILR